MRLVPQSGVTLIEMMVAIAIIGIMFAIMAPNMARQQTNARERSVVQKFTQDYDWARARGAAGNISSLTLKADCTWTTTTGSTDDAAHSMSSANLTSTAPALTCAGGTIGLPVTFTFTGQGFSSSSGTLTFTGSQGTTWPLQVLYSGSIIRVTGAS